MHTLDAEQPLQSLTTREREILRCLAERLSNQEIADRLYLSLKTVKWYNTQIFEKLGVANRAAAIRQFEAAARTHAATPLKTNLPNQATPFVGRDSELRDLAALLADPAVRIITILAPGGMGKTRLALEVAARRAHDYAGSACFVSLAQLRAPADLVTAIGGSLGLGFYGTGAPQQQLLDFLRGQELLLVLDNFEHLLAGAALVAMILEAAPGVTVLITSRERLKLSGETVYTLGGMRIPDSHEDLLTCDSVQLFLDHARRVRRDFAVDDAASLARIAQLTQGMPLGLVLAAAWADVLAPAQIAEEISRGIDALEQDMPDLPARHRSIRAVFDPTWERLNAGQRDAFMKLSVFRGGFTREAAQAAAGADLHMLAALVAKSLLQTLPNQRYAIHELLRHYGESRLDTSGMATAAHTTHAAFFMDFLAQREADVKGRRQLAALQEITDDFQNIHNAWVWALTHEQFAAIDCALECLAIAGELTGRLLETRALLQQGADNAAVHRQMLWERMVVRLSRLDYALRSTGDHEVVEAILGRARTRDDLLEIAWCLWVLAAHAAICGRDDLAESQLEELIALSATTGNDYLRAQGLTSISWRYSNRGEVARAVDCLRESIAIRRSVGDVKNLGFATVQLSWMIFDLLQDAVTAESLLDEQIVLQDSAGTTSILPLLLGTKAAMTFWRNERAAALKLAQQGLEIARHQDYLGGKSMCQGVLAMAENCDAHDRQSQRLYEEIASPAPNALSGFLAHWGSSMASFRLRDTIGALRSLIRALGIACRFKSLTFQTMCLPLAAVIYLGKDDPVRATEHLGYCFAQPPHLTAWLHHWPLLTALRVHLQSQLGVEAYTAAWARGQALKLNTEAARLLAELQPIDC